MGVVVNADVLETNCPHGTHGYRLVWLCVEGLLFAASGGMQKRFARGIIQEVQRDFKGTARVATLAKTT
jgi:hypothetical protein